MTRRSVLVPVCPCCAGDIEHEGATQYWCPACRRSWDFTEVAFIDEGDDDD